ncbi:MAG TPA: outer membrane protein assembly factor BamE [Geminicoccaceae bacterium]|nr:outer membrane protein assembly factor BamE [Geminicoccaceae bacterium]
MTVPRTSRRRRPSRAGALAVPVALAAALAAAACSPTVKIHGQRLDEEALARIEPGQTTREQVVGLLGSPSAVGTFDDESWYYISQKTEQLSFYQQEVVAQDVVAITFDGQGVVAALDRHGLEEARAVDPVDRATPTAGNELGLIEQLIGNIGRFDQRAADGDGASLPGQR